MTSSHRQPRLASICALSLLTALGTARFWPAQAAETAASTLAPEFDKTVKPFLQKNCVTCHQADAATAGVRVDQLDASLSDAHIRVWEGIEHRVKTGTMPPKGLPQPTAAERQLIVQWIEKGLGVARLRPAPKNGLVRRLTVAQYRNTLRELLHLEDDLTEALPPDAVSKDGFVNNKDTLQLSPLLLEAYLEMAEEGLQRAIVDPKAKPSIQNFRMDLGRGVNPSPIPDKLILGAGSALLENADVLVTQLTAKKPFPFEPFFMRTKYRFIEGYQGNDTVRGWREYDSIYHAVFADMRGSNGYPKGTPYSLVPEGLLLRPSIPNDETFQLDGTYGPKANFKISLRELPDYGRFRISVTAAKYDDGLLLDAGAAPAPENVPGAVAVTQPGAGQTVMVPKAGIYQVDIHKAEVNNAPPVSDSSRLSEGLTGSWPMEGSIGAGKLEGATNFVESPFGKAVSLVDLSSGVVIPRDQTMNVGEGDFTVAAWIHPAQVKKSTLIALGKHEYTQGWYLEMVDGRGSLRFETTGADNQSNGGVQTPTGTIRKETWQHVAVVVRRGEKEAVIHWNGYPVAKGEVRGGNLDNPQMAMHLGRMPIGGQQFHGEIDEVRIYRRALGEAEVQALVEPGRRFAVRPADKPQDVTLKLGHRELVATHKQPAFAVVRLEAGALPLKTTQTGLREMERVVLTPLEAGSAVAQRFLAFEKRSPRLGVQLGLRRDCGSTFAPVGLPQNVAGTKLARYVFEGAIRNFPSPDVEKDNVNYLAGVREFAVHSEYTDGRDMPRLLIKSVEFEGPLHEQWPPESHKSIFIASSHQNDKAAYAREVIRHFATRAYRRPLTAAEETQLMQVYQKAAASGRSFQDGVKDTLQVVLTSPQFLFLTETSATPAPEPLDSYELASKLAYFLWDGPPDRLTLQLAASGQLRGKLDTEVDRLIADPRSSLFISQFTGQWLSLDKFQVVEPDRAKFPKLNRDSRAQLKLEPIQFVQHLIRNNLPVKNLIQSDFVMANETVASFYDLGEKTERGFEWIPITHGRRELGGVLSQAAIMAGLSDGRESNPVKRGAWLARRIIAEPPADPPPNVPALKESAEGLTLRQRLEQHRNQTGCQQCHTKIDPWGVPFEEFDAGGRLKKDKVDASSTLPDKTEIKGVDDLRRYLSEDRIDQVAFSTLKHLATYATGRTLTFNELSYLKQDGLKLKPNGYRMKDMVRYVVTSRIFLEK